MANGGCCSTVAAIVLCNADSSGACANDGGGMGGSFGMSGKGLSCSQQPRRQALSNSSPNEPIRHPGSRHKLVHSCPKLREVHICLNPLPGPPAVASV